jgi:hypothetical protein
MPYVLQPDDLTNAKIAFTDDGGLAIRLINGTGADSVKGTVIHSHTSDLTVEATPVNVPDAFGVVYEDDIANGQEMWVVIAGIADVLFSNAPTAGYLARTGLTVDTGEVAGQALSENIPTSPFATDKHFCEIGHILETKAAAGLAKVNLHFN